MAATALSEGPGGATAPAAYVVCMAATSWFASSGGVRAVALLRNHRKKSFSEDFDADAGTSSSGFVELPISSTEEDISFRGQIVLNPLNVPES